MCARSTLPPPSSKRADQPESRFDRVGIRDEPPLFGVPEIQSQASEYVAGSKRGMVMSGKDPMSEVTSSKFTPTSWRIGYSDFPFPNQSLYLYEVTDMRVKQICDRGGESQACEVQRLPLLFLPRVTCIT